MLTCKEVTNLIGTDALQHATVGMRLRVRLHLFMCRHCSAYLRSMRQLAEVARRATHVAPESAARDEAVLKAVHLAISARDESLGSPGS